MIPLMLFAVASSQVALRCVIDSPDKPPPMFITLNDASHTVQVSIAGQTYFQDTTLDGVVAWWQFKNESNGTVVRSRLNRADGTLIITNEFGPHNRLLKGQCSRAPKRF